MVVWRGNLLFRVYSLDKLVKYGLKVYVLCDLENVYCLRFKLYIGKKFVQLLENGVIYDFIMDLMRNYFEKGYIFYCDNYYSLSRFFMDLWVFGIGVIGIVRSYRKGILDKLKKVQFSNRGDIVIMLYGFLSCLKYLDVKVVYLISIIDIFVNVEIRRFDFMRNYEVKVRFFMVYVYD